MLLSQDLYILLKLSCSDSNWTYASLSELLNISTSQIHAGIKRAQACGLFSATQHRPNLRALEELIIHGVKYVFPATKGSVIRGIPTAFAGPPLNKVIVHSEDMVPVWAYPKGTHLGYLIEPLHPSAPEAASSDKQFYELLCLVDAIREGRARERQLAAKEIQRRLHK
jgi:hypothetical protein